MKLGDVVRDKISGFTGVATCRLDYLNGCVRWAVTPQELHEGKPIESSYFDEEQLEATDKPAVTMRRGETGGDRPAPIERKNPAR